MAHVDDSTPVCSLILVWPVTDRVPPNWTVM